MKVQYLIVFSLALTSASLSAKGLKDLKPKEEDLEKVKDGAKKLLEKTKKKVDGEKIGETKPEKEPEKKITQYNRDFMFDINLAYSSVEGSKGDWGSGLSGDFRVGYRYLSAMSGKLELYGTYHFLPVSSVVSYEKTDYQSITEFHLFGTTARYHLNEGLHLVGHGEIGLSQSTLDVYGTPTHDEKLEESGASILLGGGAQWRLKEKFWIGGFINAAAGTHTLIQGGFSTHLAL